MIADASPRRHALAGQLAADPVLAPYGLITATYNLMKRHKHQMAPRGGLRGPPGGPAALSAAATPNVPNWWRS